MAEEHIYRLSSIDQSLIRTYIRYGLCYRCEDADVSNTDQKLLTAVKRTVTHIPILAGTIQKTDSDSQRGSLEVSVTLDKINAFRPTIKHIEAQTHIPTYADLSAAAMPPMELIGEDFTPLPDVAEPEGSPVFAVQASFIRGGLMVALYLHHSVTDIHGLGMVMREMSSDLPSCKLTDSDLRRDALEQSRLRDRLSGSRGVKADPAEHQEYNRASTNEGTETALATQMSHGCCRILGFDLKLIEGTKDMINERIHYSPLGHPLHISGFDCIAAILWKAVSRASWPQGVPEDPRSPQHSTLIIPVNTRNRIDPPLGNDFFGNAGTHATTNAAIVRLGMPFELTSLQHTATQIRTATAGVTEHYVRTAIAAINERENVIENNIPSHRFETNLVITSWADLPLSEAHLGLGLGVPEWGRKLGRTHSAFGCIVLPVKRVEGVWEVMIQLTEEAMERMGEDEGLLKYVKWVA